MTECERCELLLRELGAREQFPTSLRLTPSETVVLGVIYKRDVARHSAIAAALYSLRVDDWPNSPQVVGVLMVKIKRKLRPHGVTIENVPRVGYCMNAESKERLRSMMEKRQ